MLRHSHHFLYRPPTPFHPQFLPHPHKSTHFTIHPMYPTTLVKKNDLSTRQDSCVKNIDWIQSPNTLYYRTAYFCSNIFDSMSCYFFSFSGQGLPLWHMLILSNRTQSVISDDMVCEKSSWRYQTQWPSSKITPHPQSSKFTPRPQCSHLVREDGDHQTPLWPAVGFWTHDLRK